MYGRRHPSRHNPHHHSRLPRSQAYQPFYHPEYQTFEQPFYEAPQNPSAYPFCEPPDEAYCSGSGSISDDDQYEPYQRQPASRRRHHGANPLLDAHMFNAMPSPSHRRSSLSHAPADNFIYPTNPIPISIDVLDNGYPVNRIEAHMGDMSIRELRRVILKDPAYGIRPKAELMILVGGEEMNARDLDGIESVRAVVGRGGCLRGVVYQDELGGGWGQGHGHGRRRGRGMKTLGY